jgi:hypothetical protein
MEVANTLAYYNMVTIKGVKCFTVKAPSIRLHLWLQIFTGYARIPPFEWIPLRGSTLIGSRHAQNIRLERK